MIRRALLALGFVAVLATGAVAQTTGGGGGSSPAVTNHAVAVGTGIPGQLNAAGTGTAGQFMQSGGSGSDPAFANTMYLYSSTTTSGSQASVTVSSIPAGWRNMKIVVSGRGDTSASSVSGYMQFNGDTGANYDTQYIINTSDSAVAAGASRAQNQVSAFNIPAATATTGRAGTATIEVPNYSGAIFDKTLTTLNAYEQGTVTGTSFAVYFTNTWRSTAAITSVKVFLSTGNFVDGTTIDVYLY